MKVHGDSTTNAISRGNNQNYGFAEVLTLTKLCTCFISTANNYLFFYQNWPIVLGNTLMPLLAPKASEASMGAFYFRERVNGCCNGACGYCCAIGVQHTEVPNLGASWSRFLAVTLMMV